NAGPAPSVIMDMDRSGLDSIPGPKRATPASVRIPSASWTAAKSATAEMPRVADPGKVSVASDRAARRDDRPMENSDRSQQRLFVARPPRRRDAELIQRLAETAGNQGRKKPRRHRDGHGVP